MPLAGDLLRRDGEEAVRLIVKELVSQAREAAPRCVDPEDAEGLHDFRVSIRRLRSTLSAWKGLLRGVVTKRDRRTLAGFQNRTGASRDAEVALVWLESQRSELCPEHLPGLEWVEARLRSACPRRGRTALFTGTECRDHRAVCAEFADGLGGRLRVAHGPPRAGTSAASGSRTPALYAEALAERVDRIAHRLDARVDGLGWTTGSGGPHKVRIACKRLRYLVEPVGADQPRRPERS